MSKESAIAVILLLIAIALAAYYISDYQARISSVQNQRSVNAGGGTITLTAAEIVKHSSAQDCWMIIEGNVYSVSNYLNIHPGGAERMTPYCGQDATAAFQTKGGQGTHSQSALQQLGLLYIGSLGGSITNSTGTNSPAGSGSGTNTPPSTVPPATVALTAAEISKHSSQQSCWLIIEGKVYDTTNYLNIHPGGASRIIPYCGQDATAAFQTKGGQGTHSQSALQDLGLLYIGDLNGQANLSSLNNTPNIPPYTGGDDEWEYEDD